MKKIYEHPRGEIIEILFHSPLMVSEGTPPENPVDPFGAPKRKAFERIYE